jgi:hypoxanthine-DNA glycosylase
MKLAGIALWDVLARCERAGSLDASIERESEQPNPIVGLLERHRQIQRVLFNGAAAETCFKRHILPELSRPELVYMRLPSTSPANARLRFEDKFEAWRAGLLG